IGGCEVEIFHIEQAAQLLPGFAEKIFLIEGGAESATNFVQNVKLFGASRGLLNEVAVFDGHADLVAKSKKQAQFGGGKTAIVGRAEEQEAESLFLGLQADDDDAPQTVLESKFPEMADGLVFFEGREVIVAKIAEAEQTAKARDEAR